MQWYVILPLLHMYFWFASNENRDDLWASSFYLHDEASVPPGLETGKHFVGW